MSVKYKIIKAETRDIYDWNGDCEKRFLGFKLDGVVGTVDPFIDGKLIVAELQDVEGDAYINAELEWAESQVGKYLHCDELLYIAAFTSGDVVIK